MREGTFQMRERECQMRHFRAIAQDLAALGPTRAQSKKARPGPGRKFQPVPGPNLKEEDILKCDVQIIPVPYKQCWTLVTVERVKFAQR